MDTEKIINDYRDFSRQLHIALSTMEKKSTIFELKEKIRMLQDECEHFDHNYNWELINGYCPYCGKKLTNN